MSCYIMLCYVMSCHVMSCHVMSCHVMSCYVISCCVSYNHYLIQWYQLHNYSGHSFYNSLLPSRSCYSILFIPFLSIKKLVGPSLIQFCIPDCITPLSPSVLNCLNLSIFPITNSTPILLFLLNITALVADNKSVTQLFGTNFTNICLSFFLLPSILGLHNLIT
jgi:hypothetical protein